MPLDLVSSSITVTAFHVLARVPTLLQHISTSCDGNQIELPSLRCMKHYNWPGMVLRYRKRGDRNVGSSRKKACTCSDIARAVAEE